MAQLNLDITPIGSEVRFHAVALGVAPAIVIEFGEDPDADDGRKVDITTSMVVLDTRTAAQAVAEIMQDLAAAILAAADEQKEQDHG